MDKFGEDKYGRPLPDPTYADNYHFIKCNFDRDLTQEILLNYRDSKYTDCIGYDKNNLFLKL
jgi:hypothetical protein